MFLDLLSRCEGEAFLELASLALNLDDKQKDYELGNLDSYKTELNLESYIPKGKLLSEILSIFEKSSIQVKRCVIIELSAILYTDKEDDNEGWYWILDIAQRIGLTEEETERLSRWSKDFCDFVEVGLMYINCK